MLGLDVAGGAHRLLMPQHQLARGLHEQLAAAGQRHAMRSAREQGRSHPLLHAAHDLGDGRLGQLQGSGRTPEMAMLGHG